MDNSAPSTRTVYLITYSKAEEHWSRESFANVIVETFENNGNATVKQWVCSQEPHEDGRRHFHIAIKLDRPKRWLRVRNQLQQSHNINVNFSNAHSNYFDAWEYTTKEDVEFLQSPDHPDLSAGFVPRTASAINRRRSTSSSVTAGETNVSCKRKFDALDLADVIIAKKIKNKADLFKLANEQKNEGKRDLPLYVLNNTDKCVKLISTTWEMKTVEEQMIREAKSRLEILEEKLLEECTSGCNGMWLECSLQTLERNNISAERFAKAVKTLLKYGRGKFRNIIITGAANCGKTFLLQPLTDIFRAFVNPAQNSFAWTGAEKSEIIFLNDIRWSDKLIPWNNFLQLLEGAKVHLSAPKNHAAEDILFSKDTPIFATSIAKIRKYTAGTVNEMETEMMDARWNIFNFHYQISRENIKEIPPCSHCFSKLILENC